MPIARRLIDGYRCTSSILRRVNWFKLAAWTPAALLLLSITQLTDKIFVVPAKAGIQGFYSGFPPSRE